MGEREHLRCLGISPVDEYQGSQRIHQREAPKLLGIKRATCVTANHTAHHHQDARRIRVVDKLSQRAAPGFGPSPLFDTERKRFSYAV